MKQLLSKISCYYNCTRRYLGLDGKDLYKMSHGSHLEPSHRVAAYSLK